MWTKSHSNFLCLCAFQKRCTLLLAPKKHHCATRPVTKLPKDVSGVFPAIYNSELVESGWFEWWEQSGLFRPENAQEATSGSFSMVLPPPNITGDLHLGHALTVAIQDTLVRWHRMQQRKVVWVPGCDHAGIATQSVLEKRAWAQGGLTRHQMGRTAFLQEAQAWRRSKEANILRQLRRLGASLDYTRSTFTMDESMSHAVKWAFCRLFDDGLVYREKRMVNWCCWLQSAISDSEVKHVQVSPGTLLRVPGCPEAVEVGYLDRLAFPVGDTEVEVCTTRPETMLADTALAVHPEDNRYRHLIGRMACHPITGTSLPIIANSQVDRAFGTGAMKVTPGYSRVDHQLAKEHGLPVVECFDDQGRVVEGHGTFSGLSGMEAKAAVLALLKEKGLYRGRVGHESTVPVCSRTGDLIDVRLKPQFFLDFSKLARQALACMEEGHLSITPAYWRKAWSEWLSKPEDWCISRQLWWGHRIPAYRVLNAEEETWVSGMTEEEAASKAAARLGISREDVCLKQDEDVLDTWFSSALFPLAVSGWPEKPLPSWFPLSLMETGHDILFFWVARMVALTLQLTGKLPFHKVMLHGMIRDSEGRKMSKSLGNVIDPLDVVHGKSLEELEESTRELQRQGYIGPEELATALRCQRQAFPSGIEKCGSDALRLALLSYDVQAETISFQMKDAVRWLHFCNKLWQATRFFVSAADKLGQRPQLASLLSVELELMDRWILSRLSFLVEASQAHLSNGDLHLFTSAVQAFVVQHLCDVYLESIKPAVWGNSTEDISRVCSVLHAVLDVTLKTLSPAAPFLTEELYQRLALRFGGCAAPSICVAPYPTRDQWDQWRNEDLERQVRLALEVVTTLRNVRLSCGIKEPSAHVAVEPRDAGFLHDLAPIVRQLARVREFRVVHRGTAGPPVGEGWTPAPVGSWADVFVETDVAVVQKAVQERLQRLTVKLHKMEQRRAHPKYTRSRTVKEQERDHQKILDLKSEIERLKAT
ncbi:valine--tRNA ligase, mitochondrial isoform X3 [Ixodes scapularis]|nr:valine--tRNA ligase, mitochondrial isoform X3 [Ixodes scapularis]